MHKTYNAAILNMYEQQKQAKITRKNNLQDKSNLPTY